VRHESIINSAQTGTAHEPCAGAATAAGGAQQQAQQLHCAHTAHSSRYSWQAHATQQHLLQGPTWATNLDAYHPASTTACAPPHNGQVGTGQQNPASKHLLSLGELLQSSISISSISSSSNTSSCLHWPLTRRRAENSFNSPTYSPALYSSNSNSSQPDGPANSSSTGSTSSGSSGSSSSSSGAPPSSWLLQHLPAAAVPYAQLMRLDKPIGSWLLAWPGLWWVVEQWTTLYIAVETVLSVCGQQSDTAGSSTR
jgi:hypothetical protein